MRLVWATYNYFPERFGGTEVYVAGVARVLRQMGHSLQIVAGTVKPARSPDVQFETAPSSYEGTPVLFFSIQPERFRWRELLSLETEEMTRWWARRLAEHPCDLVHVHGYSPACSVSLVVAAKQVGLPVAVSFHHPGQLCARGDFVQAWGQPCDGQVRIGRCSACFGLTKGKNLAASWKSGGAGSAGGAGTPGGRRGGVGGKLWTALSLPWQFRLKKQAWGKLVSHVDGWHAFSEPTRRMLLCNGVPEDRIRVISHGTDPVPSLSRRPSSETRIGYVGRFHPEKGVELLIQAIRSTDPGLPLKFLFFGQAQDRQEQKTQEALKELERRDRRVRLEGAFPPSQAAEVFTGLDTLVVPSLAFETGPLVVLEAFRAGIPVIGPRWGSLPALVQDGVNGLLFPWGDARALARCLERIGREPGLLQRLQSGVKPPESTEAHVHQMLEFYRQLRPGRSG